MKRAAFFLCLMLAFVFFLNPGQLSLKQNEKQLLPQRCPMNPDYLAYPFPSRWGYLPPPMDLSHLERDATMATVGVLEVLPAAWDWRAYNGTTPAKNQGSCPTCWIFAGTGALESRVLVHSGVAYDLAEENVKECNDSNRGCFGGTVFNVANYFINHGAVLEACSPYHDDPTGVCNSSCPKIIQPTGWRLVGSSDVQVIKSRIYQYGPCQCSMFASWPEFINYDGSYVLYHAGTEPRDHNVMIVGWDDNLPHAGGKGAWICKNSWGTAWGDNGFFYIAYGSAGIGGIASYFDSYKYHDDQETLYLYDEGGWSDSFGFPGSNTAWGLVKFIAKKDDCLQGVDFWATVYHLSYTISIYDNFDGYNVSNLLHSQSGTIDSGGGYFSIPLSSPVCVSKGNDFVVVVKLTCTSGYAYTVPTDYVNTYYPIESGKCFISPNGSPGSWTDMGVTYNRDIGIRVRAKNIGELPPVPPANLVATALACDKIRLSWTDNSNSEAGFKVERSENGVDFGQVGAAAADVITFNDTGLTENKTYWYRVKAYNSGGDSSYTNIASALTPTCPHMPPAAPSNLVVSAKSRTMISLVWLDNAANEDGFKLYRKTLTSALRLIATLGPNAVSYTDNSLKSRTWYIYKICAFNAYGKSCSQKISIRTK